MKYIVRACEQSYGGLHGIESWFATESTSLSHVEDDAYEASCEIMYSYDFIEQYLKDQAEFYSGETEGDNFDEAYSDAMAENVSYTIWSVNVDKSLKEIQKEISEDPETFVSNYCDIVVAC